ncbi:MAG: ArsA family ATPase [Myxococcota bacterium]|nr:ArsA family ATPase [Myxococcota bacterium]
MSHARILYITGKGGVGKSVVSAALGLHAARRGLRTVIAEPSGAARMPELFGVPPLGYQPTELQEGLFSVSITPEEAMEEYIVQQIRFQRLYQMVFRNRVMGPFVDGVPGLQDAVQLGKIFDLELDVAGDGRAWDLVLVDAPATGHGLTLLNSARSMMDLTRAGPLFEGNKLVEDKMSDPTVLGLVLVALPEEMPVAETLDLWQRLGARRGQVQACIVNQCVAAPMGAAVNWPKARTSLVDGPPPLAEATSLLDAWVARHERQQTAAARLEAALPVPMLRLPDLPDRDVGVPTLDILGADLADALLGPEGEG